MKRALAERAKQSETTAAQNGLGPTAAGMDTDMTTTGAMDTSASMVASSGQPPRKIPRIHEVAEGAVAGGTGAVPSIPQQQPRIKVEPVTIPSSRQQQQQQQPQASTVPPTTTSSSSTPRPSPSGTPREKRSSLKRQRSTAALTDANNQEDDDDDGDSSSSSAFYLKHQNRALASELKGIQYQLRLLEKERNVRRQQCQEAGQALQALHNTWTQMEVALQLATQQIPPGKQTELDELDQKPPLNAQQTSIRNTGSGDNVELVGSLLDSLASLGKATTDRTAGAASAAGGGGEGETTATTTNTDNHTDMSIDTTVRRDLVDMKETAVAISQRSAALQRWIWNLLQQGPTTSQQQTQPKESSSSSSPLAVVNDSNNTSSIQTIASLEGQVAELQQQCRHLERCMAELATTKQEAVDSDYKVRRGLYRLAAGRLKLDEVIKAVEEIDTGGMAAADIKMQVAQEGAGNGGESLAAIATSASALSAADTTTVAAAETTLQQGDDAAVDGAQVLQLKKKLQDLEEIASTRETQIEKLLKEQENDSKRINSLSIPTTATASQSAGVSAEDIKRSSLYTDTATRLVTAERQLNELRMQMETLMTKYVTAKGDAELATKTLEEHLAAFHKRWAELSTSTADGAEGGADFDDLYDDAEKGSGSGGDGAQRDRERPSLLDSAAQAKRIVELEHKLKQALEHVRQTDTIRVSLTEAQMLNKSLQEQLEEYRSKYTTVMAGRMASRSTSENALSSKDTTPSSSSSTPISADKAAKLRRENKKMKKDIAAAFASKGAAKAKQDKAEKERDGLLETNSRLLKQNMEKDDMNAKSLATILHLKSLTEQAEKEKLAQQREGKSAEQVALASRLAENARERVAEEALKEKKLLEDRVAELEKECDRVKREKEVTDGALSQTRAEIASMKSSVGTLKDRCEELAVQSTRLQEEKQKLGESLAVAEREVVESSKKLLETRNQGGVGASGFTMEQLEKQASFLKGRLTCPVCNHRDKACILSRCRHMFCKECVEENVKNRSRKCPACGQRFDNKDVQHIFL